MSYLKVGIIIILLIIGTVSAQEVTPEATEEALPNKIEFQIFTLPESELSGIAPAEWDEIVIGSYLNREDEDDTTYILQFTSAETDTSQDELITSILATYDMDTLPEDSDIYESELFEWSIYTFEFTPSDETSETLAVDIAIAEKGSVTAFIFLQTTTNDYEALHETVFLPALDYFGQSIDDIEANIGSSAFTTTTLASFGIDTQVPTTWENINPGSFARGNLQEDPTTLLIQTSSDLSEAEFRDLFLERLGISIVETGETYEAAYLDWTIYTFEIDAEGTLLSWQIATAEDDDFAYLVVLFSFSEERETLREMIFLPVLDATQQSE